MSGSEMGPEDMRKLFGLGSADAIRAEREAIRHIVALWRKYRSAGAGWGETVGMLAATMIASQAGQGGAS